MTQTPENLKARLKESYDAIAPVYNKWTVSHSPTRMTYLNKLLELLPVSSSEKVSVLELGCGAGVPTTQKLLSFPNFTVTANDLSSAQIALGKATLGQERANWLEGDMMALDFPEASFDAVVGFYSLIHLPREEQVTLLGRILKWLKPGGYVLANFAGQPAESIIKEKWLGDKGWMFWSGWGAEATLERVKDAGLEVVVGKVEEDDVDVSFLWVIAKKP